MDKAELFKIIQEKRIFKNVGTFFLVVDDSLQIHFISFDPVDQDRKICIGDYLKCTNALSSTYGCGSHENCLQCPVRNLVERSFRHMERLEGDASLLLEHNLDRSVHVISTPFIKDGKKYSIVLLVDRTDRTRELAMERIFCHDLLNLSCAINGMLDCLDGDNQTETLDALKSISAQLIEEIKSQRDLIYAINGILKTDKKIFKASDVVEYVQSSLVKVAAEIHNTTLIVDSTLGDECINSDTTLVNRVINNMVKNACESSCGAEVVFKARSEDGRIIFSVHNDEVMSPEVKSKIFIQGHTTKSKGHGLGTFSMKLIGENYLDGKVYFKSEEGFGTEFYIELKSSE